MTTPNFEERKALIRSELLNTMTAMKSPPKHLAGSEARMQVYVKELAESCNRHLPDAPRDVLIHVLGRAREHLVDNHRYATWPDAPDYKAAIQAASEGVALPRDDRGDSRSNSTGKRIARLKRHVEGMERRKQQYGSMWWPHEERQLQHTRALLAEALGEPPPVGDLPKAPEEPEDRHNMGPVSLADAKDFLYRCSLHKHKVLRASSYRLVKAMLECRGVDLGDGRVSHDSREVWKATGLKAPADAKRSAQPQASDPPADPLAIKLKARRVCTCHGLSWKSDEAKPDQCISPRCRMPDHQAEGAQQS